MMKNISFLCMLFVAFFAYGQKAWAQFSDGDGTPDNPYLISSANDWDALSSAVSGGTTYSGGYFRLTDDISVTTMLGSSTDKFSGTFDGNGHTLTFNQEATEQYIAPFRYVNNATIENLRVAGTVTSSNKFAGGVVAHATGSNYITNCVNSTVVNATISGNGSHGGILGQLGGENNSVAIAGCLFNGKMLGTETDYWCGLIGYFSSNSVTISNCFFNPQEINVKPTNDNYTICRSGATITNCFYNAAAAEIYSRQGSQAYSIAPDRHVTMRLLGIDYPYYNVSGITIYEDFGHGFKVGDALYAAADDVLELELGVEPGYTATKYAVNGLELGVSEFYPDCYAMRMPAQDVTITANVQVADLTGDGSEQNPYLVYNIYQLDFLFDGVTDKSISAYNDKFFKLMADMVFPRGNGELTIRYRFTLDTNGKVITTEDPEFGILRVAGAEWLSYTPSLTLTGGGTLRGYDGTSTANGGAILNEGILNIQDVTFENCHAANGGAVYNAGTMTMNGGSITDCTATSSGGAVYNAGTMTMSGGTISGCTATSSGGAVYNDAALTMDGGTITGCSATNSGGAVCNAGTMTMTSGTITDCSGGVYNDATLTMSGAPKVYGNTGGDVCLSTGKLITVNDAFISGANIHVTRTDDDESTFTSGYSTYNSQADPAGIFHCENSRRLVVLKGGEVYFCFWLGSGTEGDPYQIPSTDRWNVLVANVNDGRTYSGTNLKLTDDLTVNTMVGNSQARFQGTFDGGGHRLTLQLGSNDSYSDLQYTAPFRYTQNAVFKNLTVDGTIYTSAQYAGGVVGYSQNNCSFINCHVSATIASSMVGEGGHGGFIGYAKGRESEDVRPSFANCWFDGELLGPQTTHCAGFIGEVSVTTPSFNNCLFAPSELTIDASSSGSFLPNSSSYAYISQSYYATPLGNNHGTRIYTTVPDGEISSLLTVVNQQSYYVPVSISGLQRGYAASADEMALTCTVTSIDGTALTLDEDYTQDIRDSNNAVPTTFAAKGDYTITLTARQGGRCFGSKTIPFYIYSNWPGEGLGTEDDPYIIASVSDLNKLMELIQTYTNPVSALSGEYQFEGKFFRQTANIDYSNVTLDDNGCNYTTYSGYNTFLGTYDGDGHTISGIVAKQSSGNAFGLFGYVRGGCIKNLTVTNCTFTADRSWGGYNNYTGGIAGHLSGGTVIDNCHVTSSVYVLAGGWAQYHGGIVGYLDGGSLVSNCTSAAHVCLAEGVTPEYGMSYFGGIVGINFNSEVRNCLYLGNDVNAYEYFGAIAGTNAYVDSNWQERFSTMNHNFYHGGTLLGIGSSSGSADVPGACRAICRDKIPSGVTEDDYIAYGGKYYVRAGMLLDNGSNAELMAQNQAEGVTNYTLTGRTLWKDGDWNTLCLPFDVTIADATDLRDAEVRELESASFDDASGVLCLNFSDPVEAIEAGKPYIVKFPNEIQYSQYSMARYYDANAFDGDPSTIATISMDNHTWPVIFAASGAFNVTGYKLYSPDNMSFLPTKWELRAKLNDGDEWTVIDSRDGSADSDAMPREAGAGKEYALAADKQGLYRYFNLFVTDVDNDGAGQMKLGEIELLGDLENQQIYTPTFTDVTLTATEPTPIDCGPVTFQGTYSSTTFTESDQSILFLGAGNKIYYPLESARIGAFRAYFQLNGIAAGAPDTGGAIRSFNLNFDEDSQTGIEMVQEGKGSCVPSVASGKPSARAQDFYDLSGRRVEKATRGIYIRNGRKMIIK